MYQLSRDKRTYSPTPIVWVDDNGKESFILCAVTQKGEGSFFDRLRETNKLSQEIANFLNKKS